MSQNRKNHIYWRTDITGREMVVTRSGASTMKQPVKIKFLEDGENPEGEFLTADEGDENEEEDAQEEDEDSEDDSDSDDAPEEESTVSAKKNLLQKQKQEQQIQQELKRAEREKRKQQDDYNKQQKSSKKQKIEAEPLPEFLPEELLESIENEPVQVPKNKHIRLDEVDEKELRRQAKIQKLTDLKRLRTSSINKGPVHVQVQSFSHKSIIPKAEKKITASRDKWLKRRSLNKK